MAYVSRKGFLKSLFSQCPTEFSFDNQTELINQNFSHISGIVATKIDGFLNPLLEIDGFSRTRSDDITKNLLGNTLEQMIPHLKV